MSDVNVEALNHVMEATAKESEAKLASLQNRLGNIREESMALGILQKINYDNAHNELLKYAMLYQIRQNKAYKKEGMTFEGFCEAAGENVRNVNRTLKDIKPLYDKFQDNLSCFLDIPLNKIRYLGRKLQGNLSRDGKGELILGDERIPLTQDNKDEIEAAIDILIETHKKEQKQLKHKLDKVRKGTEKIVAEETRGLRAERDALVKEVARLKPFDIEDRDISWCEAHLKGLQGVCVAFEKGLRKMVMDNRIHEDMHIQAKCEALINLMSRGIRDLQWEWDEEFNSNEKVTCGD